jgi:EpsD family peptidyl-prolyl cis-trans isomerase
MIRIRVLLLMVVLSSLAAFGCSKKETAKVDETDDVLAARIGDWTITREYVEEYLRRLPEPQKTRFSTPEGRALLTEKLMQEELAYLEAKKSDLISRPEVKKQIDDATRSILVTAYLDEMVDSKARPSDEEMHEYYDAHQDQYTQLETLRAQHVFSTDKQKLEEIKERVVEGGEKFTTMAHMYSEDQITKGDGGDLGYFNPGGYIRGVGYSKEFTEALAQMEPGQIYGPIKWEKGYSLVRINEKQPAVLRPYDEVREEIADVLSRDKLENVRMQHFAEVQTHYDTENYLREEYDKMQRGPEELFNYAQNSSDPQQRIAAFQQIIDKFPQDKYAPQAMFMIGFVYAEELKDFTMADRTFNDVIVKYPDTEMAQTARWMLDNLEKPLPKFEDLDDLNRQIDAKSD